MTISNPRIEVKDAPSSAWFGVPETGKVPARVTEEGWNAPRSAPADARREESRSEQWTRRARRALVDLALVLGVMTAIPVLTVATLSDGWWRSDANVENIREKLRYTTPLRAYSLPKDPSITPLEAGRAFAAIQPLIEGNGASSFPMVDVVRPAVSWRGLKMGPAMFATARPMSFEGPNSESIFEAAAKGFSAEELAYLRTLATAPVWREFDRIARAPAIDLIGGQFVLPFKASAAANGLPIMRFSATKEMAHAAVSRAAYHYAIGQRDSAETILRSIVSFGFGLSDNGSFLIDNLIGRVIVGIGRSGLEHYYVVTKDPRADAVRFPLPSGAALPSLGGLSTEEIRQELLRRVNDPHEIRGVRTEALMQLAWSQCSNVRELLFGVRPDVGEAFERAKLDLARFPSERAVLDLIRRAPPSNQAFDMVQTTPISRFMVGAASIAGAALRNPRLGQCTWLATARMYPPYVQ